MADSVPASHSYPLGNRQPPGYVGYLDEDRGEVYAYAEKTGECCYGVGADGDVFAVDYRCVFVARALETAVRSVLWLPVEAAESCSTGRTRVKRRSVDRFSRPVDAVVFLCVLLGCRRPVTESSGSR